MTPRSPAGSGPSFVTNVAACFKAVAFAMALTIWAGPLAAQEITLVAGGDVEWAQWPPMPGLLFNPPVYWHPEEPQEGEWQRVPYLNRQETREYLRRVHSRVLEGSESHWVNQLEFNLTHLKTQMDTVRHPWQRVRPVLRDADIAFINLEMPLSETARNPNFQGRLEFAEAMRWAGIDVVTTANNHAWDSEGEGMLHTLDALRSAGIGAAGTGMNLAEARAPYIIERQGIRVAFFGYTSHSNFESVWALPDRSGAVPMDPLLIEEDIARVRADVDYIIVAPHWNPMPVGAVQEAPHPDSRAFAKRILDAGADVFFGHGPHVPIGLETYEGKVIVYGSSQLMFGHNHPYWEQDNYLIRLSMTPERITKLEVLPVAGIGEDLGQPYVLPDGERAQKVLRLVQEQAREMGTMLRIEGNVGVVEP